MAPLTVMHIIYGLKYGGAEKLLISFARRTDQRRYRIIIVALSCGGPVEEELRRYGADVRVLRRSGHFSVRDLFALIGLIKREKVSIVHTHLISADIWGGIAAKLLGKKHVSTIHGGYYVSDFLADIKHKIRMFFPGAIIAVSESTRLLCIERFGVPPEKIRVIYNGVPRPAPQDSLRTARKREEFGIRKDALILGTFGRLEVEKGHRYLLEAVSLLKKTFPHIVLLVVGDGSLKEDLGRRASSLGLDGQVFFLGENDAMAELIALMDIILFPSLHEGLSLACLEAMAAGKPVIASSVGGMRELIEDKKSGILLPPRDIRALAAAAERLIQDSGFSHALSLAAKERVEKNFSEKEMISKTEALYDSIVRER